MREEDSNWFAKWEDELPPPEELTPLSQSLISPDLALAFDIRKNPNHGRNSVPPAPEFDPGEFCGGSGGGASGSGGYGGGAVAGDAVCGGDEAARTLKRPRLVWTPQLHKRFVDAVAHLGIKNAVPKTIMQLMRVDGLTRENVASHLQKYRLYLKRMQGFSGAGASVGGGGGGGAAAGVDAPTDHLFTTSPVPAHFLRPFIPNHHRLVAAGSDGGHYHQFRNFGSPASTQFEHRGVQRMVAPPYAEDVDSASVAVNGRKILTLFPTGDD